MQAKDERFLLAGQKIKAGQITRFSEIFKIVPKTVVAKALAKNVRTSLPLIKNDPYYFKVGELLELAGLMAVKGSKVLSLMEVDIQAAEASRVPTTRTKGHTASFMKKAKEAQRLFATGKYNKTQLAVKIKVSRNQLYQYLKYHPKI
ncbi:hypothetical protein V9K67_21925 [Paraflavisolibacter sp. H34]|uniref:hypothetical protein n=1 Tax=Huijunlia imazamoxiresistens TaxID=3127457 RepID=UPI003015BF61